MELLLFRVALVDIALVTLTATLTNYASNTKVLLTGNEPFDANFLKKDIDPIYECAEENLQFAEGKFQTLKKNLRFTEGKF